MGWRGRDRGLSRKQILKQIDASLRRLRTDYVRRRGSARRARARRGGGGRVGVVDHEALARAQARLQERRLARTRAHEIHGDADVGLEEAVAVERRLAAAQDAAEDDRLHVVIIAR